MSSKLNRKSKALKPLLCDVSKFPTKLGKL